MNLYEKGFESIFLVFLLRFCLSSSQFILQSGWWAFNKVRIFCVKHIFKRCGKISTIETHAYFGNGCEIEMGDGSRIGANNHIPNNIKIGNDVMMGPDIYVIGNAEKSRICKD